MANTRFTNREKARAKVAKISATARAELRAVDHRPRHAPTGRQGVIIVTCGGHGPASMGVSVTTNAADEPTSPCGRRMAATSCCPTAAT
ncbi:MAG: hypothetical protein ACM3W4_03840 [Ignavibacteriales bacterium]